MKPDGQGGQRGHSESKAEDESLIPKHGGYRKLRSFQVAQRDGRLR